MELLRLLPEGTSSGSELVDGGDAVVPFEGCLESPKKRNIIDGDELALALHQGHQANREDVPSSSRKRPCFGCKRTYKTEFSYFVPGQHVEWPYEDGRGEWCKDCFVLWRIVYKPTVPLALLPVHIKRDESSWTASRVAFLTLKKEGRQRLEASDINCRCEMIAWLGKLLGVPMFGSFVLRLLEDVSSVDVVAPSSLVTVVQDQLLKIGCFESNPDFAIAQVAKQMRRLLATMRTQMLLPDIRSNVEADIQLAQQAGAAIADEAVPPCGALVPCALASAPLGPPKLSAAIAAANAGLLIFSQEAWHHGREGVFSASMTALAKVRTEVVASASDLALRRLDAWSGGVASAKTVLKLHREYSKGYKHQKFMSMREHVQHLLEFLSLETSIGPSASFKLFALKLDFFQVTCDEGLGVGCDLLVKRELYELFEAHVQNIAGTRERAAQPSLSIWLSTAFLRVVSDMISATTVELIDDDLKKLDEEIADAEFVLVPYCESLAEAENFLEDLAAARVVVKTAAGDTGSATANAAEKSLKHFTSAWSMKPLADALKRPLGQEILTRVGEFVRASAEDMLADKSMARAVEFLVGAGSDTLCWEPGEDDESLECISRFVDTANSTLELVLESVVNVVEAALIWTPKGRSLATALLSGWFGIVVEKLRMWDDIATLYLVGRLTSILEDLPSSPAEELRHEHLANVRAFRAESLDRNDETIPHLSSIVAQLAEASQRLAFPEGIDQVKEVCKIVKTNFTSRCSVWDLVEAALEIDGGSLETGPETAVNQWRSSLGTDVSADSLLNKVNLVKQNRTLISNAVLALSEQRDGVQGFQFREIDMGRVSPDDVMRFLPVLDTTQHLNNITNFAGTCLDVVMMTFHESCSLGRIVFEFATDPVGNSTTAAVASQY